MEEFLKYFGCYVRDYRKSQHMNQSQFAALVDITPRQLSQIENGRSDCRLGTLGKLMTVIGKEELQNAILQYPTQYQEKYLLLMDKLTALDPPAREKDAIDSILTLLGIPYTK